LARKGADTVIERERHSILATDYYAHQNYEKAAAEYALVVQLAPKDLDALREQAGALSWTNQVRNAVDIQRRVLELSRDDVLDYSQLMRIQIRLNDFQPALETWQQARSRKLDSPYLHYNAALAHWGLDDIATARQELEALDQGGDVYLESFARIWLASLLVYEGRLCR
jgi:tetratricopeptide (TPR) repeat protein